MITEKNDHGKTDTYKPGKSIGFSVEKVSHCQKRVLCPARSYHPLSSTSSHLLQSPTQWQPHLSGSRRAKYTGFSGGETSRVLPKGLSTPPPSRRHYGR